MRSTARALAGIARPDISGFTGGALAQMRPGQAPTAFLGKPFTPRQLLEQVERLLGTAPGAS